MDSESHTFTGAPADTTLTQRIVRAVADAEGVDPVDLHTPLYEAVNPEALESLFGESARALQPPEAGVRFRYHGWDVRVSAAGDVAVEPIREPSPDATCCTAKE